MLAINPAFETGTNEMSSPRPALDGVYFTRFNTYETEGELVFRCPMPDVQLIQVETRVRNAELIIQGKVRFDPEADLTLSKPHCFFRSFPVSRDVVADRISAHFKDGVLTVRLPKSGFAPLLKESTR